MLVYATGNILKDNAEALVNTVNCEGFMGKGIALAFKGAYPENFWLYRRECDMQRLRPGRLFVSETGLMFGPRQIVNVATKDSWREPSRMEWIVEGARGIRLHCEASGIRTAALPALGCSNGGLSWKKVQQVLEDELAVSEVLFRVYRPL